MLTRRAALKGALGAVLGTPLARARLTQDGWEPLFNGKDLAGWDTFLGKPFPQIDVPGQPRNSKGEYLNAIGVNVDPKRVFSVVEVDGAPAIRISGEVYGALTTKRELENYHLKLEFKWGTKRWPPREQALRDSGCCYHCVGPHGASYGFWMRSFEFQIQEGDCGDFYSLAGVIVDVEGVPATPGNPKSDLIYIKGAPKVSGQTRRVVRNPGAEKGFGDWNTLELYCAGQTSVHVVNGRTNMVLTGLRHMLDGRETPLTRGRIQLQSEAAEVFYRNISVRGLRQVPEAVLK